MAAQDDTKQARTAASSPAVAPPRAYPSEERARSLPPLIEQDGVADVPAPPRDRGQIALLIGIVCALVAVIAVYVVKPAISNLAQSPRAIPAAEGP